MFTKGLVHKANSALNLLCPGCVFTWFGQALFNWYLIIKNLGVSFVEKT